MDNPYLGGLHSPVTSERTDLELPVEGTLPVELHGLFARNSGNPRFHPEGRYHWFDGDGMVHGVWFEDGKASYRNRWIRTPALEAEEQAGKALWRGILEPVDLTNPLGPIKDTANTDLTWWQGRLVATWWLSGRPQQLSVPELQTLGPVDFDGALRGTVAAHPKVDPRTGELVFFGYSIVKKPYYFYGVANADGSLARYDPIDVPRAHVPHDIAITERYSVLLDLPLGWDPKALAVGKRRIGFDRSVPARFGILPRHDPSAIRWFEAESCYVYHTVTAWEEGSPQPPTGGRTSAARRGGGNKVHLVGCRIADPIPGAIPDDYDSARMDNILLHPFLHQWTFDLETGAVTERQLDDVPTEFPRMNDRVLGTAARWSWSPRIAPEPALAFDALRKVDLHSGRWTTVEWDDGWRSGEVVFAPRPGASDEDDGWAITILSKVGEDSRCVVLDGRSCETVAEVQLPWQVPNGFHAEWCGG